MNEEILSWAKSLKDIINLVYANCNVDMALYQPGLEPLSVIGKSELGIVTKLKENLLAIFSRYSKMKSTNMRNNECLNFFGLENDELIKLAERITALIPVIDCSKNDKEFANMPFIKESNEFVETNLNKICINMLENYIRESFILVEDYQNFTITEKQIIEDDMVCTTRISSPQMFSCLLRIFYEGDNNCYCTIADAIRSNQETYIP